MKPDPAFNAVSAAKKLLREGRSGALASLMPGSGDPYCSLVNVATDTAGAPLMLLSTLALHTKNILADGRVSLMLDERKDGDPLEGARVMLMGSCTKSDDPAARAAYLRRHPEAEMFAGFGDFAVYRIDIARAHLVAGFGRIVDLKPGDVLTDLTDAQAPRPAGSTPPSCWALQTATGSAPASIRKASNCRTARRRCGCSLPNASSDLGRCARC
jgi:hypothetical protein